jgi:hypothetical protein
VHALGYRLAGTTWDALLARLAALGHRAALIGPHGHGKTTLLEHLARRLEEQGFRIRSVTLHDGDWRLTAEQEQAFFQDLVPRDCLLLDGAEQLAVRAWREVEKRSRAAGGLLVTSHRAGLLPTLMECRTTPELLDDVVRDLLGDSPDPQTAELFIRHDGNLRDALRELYDLWAER